MVSPLVKYNSAKYDTLGTYVYTYQSTVRRVGKWSAMFARFAAFLPLFCRLHQKMFAIKIQVLSSLSTI
jgi:hypothetical protein